MSPGIRLPAMSDQFSATPVTEHVSAAERVNTVAFLRSTVARDVHGETAQLAGEPSSSIPVGTAHSRSLVSTLRHAVLCRGRVSRDHPPRSGRFGGHPAPRPHLRRVPPSFVRAFSDQHAMQTAGETDAIPSRWPTRRDTSGHSQRRDLCAASSLTERQGREEETVDCPRRK